MGAYEDEFGFRTETLDTINARQAELERITAEMQADEIERAREWEASRGERLGVTPGVTRPRLLGGQFGTAPVDVIRDSTSHLDNPAVNPKQAMATRDQKLPLHLLEPTANAQIAQVLDHGAFKYGRRNFYKTPILANVYIGAVRRHIDALHEGQDLDPDTALSHWAHIGANVHVMLAAIKAGTYVDDTGPEDQSEVQARMSEASNRLRP